MANNIKIDFAEWKFKEAAPEPSCSFCKKPKSEVRVITGPGVNICNECVGLCNEILAGNELARRTEAIKDILTIEHGLGDCYQPVDIAEAIYDAGYRKPKE
ncbi:hypothetical protein WG886_004280 [Yersinia enterocolitica]